MKCKMGEEMRIVEVEVQREEGQDGKAVIAGGNSKNYENNQIETFLDQKRGREK